MGLNGCVIQMRYTGDQPQALEQVTSNLLKMGYVLKKQGAGRVKLKFSGKWFTTDPSRMRHYVEVCVADGALEFDFNTGLVASTWTESDRAWAQGRAQEAMAGLGEEQ